MICPRCEHETQTPHPTMQQCINFLNNALRIEKEKVKGLEEELKEKRIELMKSMKK